jgi:hypothetical protein
MQLDTFGSMDNEYFDDQNDLADGCDSVATPVPPLENVPPLKNGGMLSDLTSDPERLDRHPGQGVLHRLHLANLGTAEKQVLGDHAITEPK